MAINLVITTHMSATVLNAVPLHFTLIPVVDISLSLSLPNGSPRSMPLHFGWTVGPAIRRSGHGQTHWPRFKPSSVVSPCCVSSLSTLPPPPPPPPQPSPSPKTSGNPPPPSPEPSNIPPHPHTPALLEHYPLHSHDVTWKWRIKVPPLKPLK